MKQPPNPNTAPQKKEEPTTKKDEELGEGELNKVTGGIRNLAAIQATPARHI